MPAVSSRIIQWLFIPLIVGATGVVDQSLHWIMRGACMLQILQVFSTQPIADFSLDLFSKPCVLVPSLFIAEEACLRLGSLCSAYQNGGCALLWEAPFWLGWPLPPIRGSSQGVRNSCFLTPPSQGCRSHPTSAFSSSFFFFSNVFYWLHGDLYCPFRCLQYSSNVRRCSVGLVPFVVIFLMVCGRR